jgi:hypothetical protein
MKKFESNQHVLNTKEARRIIKTYNKVARTLVAFEYLWYVIVTFFFSFSYINHKQTHTLK